MSAASVDRGAGPTLRHTFSHPSASAKTSGTPPPLAACAPRASAVVRRDRTSRCGHHLLLSGAADSSASAARAGCRLRFRSCRAVWRLHPDSMSRRRRSKHAERGALRSRVAGFETLRARARSQEQLPRCRISAARLLLAAARAAQAVRGGAESLLKLREGSRSRENSGICGRAESAVSDRLSRETTNLRMERCTPRARRGARRSAVSERTTAGTRSARNGRTPNSHGSLKSRCVPSLHARTTPPGHLVIHNRSCDFRRGASGKSGARRARRHE
jgi:hypothetical protein